MRLKVASVKKLNVAELVDMTAMVDIVFFLLIFFMVTSMQGVFSSIALPATDPQKTSVRTRKSVSDFETDGSYLVVRVDRDDSIWFNGAEVPSELELLARLREARQGAAAPNKMLVLTSGDARYGVVVTVLDAGNDVGMDEVRLAFDEEL
jgi:biopolymer transport protein ExbD